MNCVFPEIWQKWCCFFLQPFLFINRARNERTFGFQQFIFRGIRFFWKIKKILFSSKLLIQITENVSTFCVISLENSPRKVRYVSSHLSRFKERYFPEFCQIWCRFILHPSYSKIVQEMNAFLLFNSLFSDEWLNLKIIIFVKILFTSRGFTTYLEA